MRSKPHKIVIIISLAIAILCELVFVGVPFRQKMFYAAFTGNSRSVNEFDINWGATFKDVSYVFDTFPISNSNPLELGIWITPRRSTNTKIILEKLVISDGSKTNILLSSKDSLTTDFAEPSTRNGATMRFLSDLDMKTGFQLDDAKKLSMIFLFESDEQKKRFEIESKMILAEETNWLWISLWDIYTTPRAWRSGVSQQR